MKSWKTFILANKEQEKIAKLVEMQALLLIENYQIPKLLYMNKETKQFTYGSEEIKSFRVEGYEVPVVLVDEDVVYLIGESL